MLKRIIRRFYVTQDQLIQEFQNHGGVIGKGCKFFEPRTNVLDMGKAFLIEIGDYCKITKGVKILAHDYSRCVTRFCYGENVGGSAPVRIGSNCFLGIDAMILMGTVIGDNCIIGAGSVVKGKFPDNVVIAGNPAKVVCTLEEFYEKRKARCLNEAIACVEQVYKNTGKLPTVRQMGDGFAWLYLPRTEETLTSYSSFFQLPGDVEQNVKRDFMNSTAQFSGFQDFLEYACEKLGIRN